MQPHDEVAPLVFQKFRPSYAVLCAVYLIYLMDFNYDFLV